ncbi:MAG: hypothetical protein Greene101449_338, partial [Candidatus Peregrinibacteria bacterium Greene1014_49]
MNGDIFLSGIGQTKFGEWWQKSLKDLIEESMSAAIADAKISPLS